MEANHTPLLIGLILQLFGFMICTSDSTNYLAERTSISMRRCTGGEAYGIRQYRSSAAAIPPDMTALER